MEKKYKRSDRSVFWGTRVNGPVFIVSLVVILILVVTTITIGKPMEQWFARVQAGISNSIGWFFIVLVNILLTFTIYLGFSKFGKIRLGGNDAKPEFSRASWFAMLFSAGMGIGLLFWSVAEPVMHYHTNPFATSTDAVESARSAMGITFLHWGVHAWAIYAVVGLALAFFTFNLKLPLTIRSIFYPIFGDKIYGWLGHIIDIVSVIATLFGLATSLGLGAQQINAGLAFLFDIQYTSGMQTVLIIIITGLATFSLILGLDKGIRRLSAWNMRLAVTVLVFIILVGPTLFIFKSLIENIGYYLSNFFELGLWIEAYTGISEEESWQNKWTIFYWAWWIAWSPFVGIFIARISKGRTIKEFILGVMLVPTLLTFLWLSAFGGSALYLELGSLTGISDAVNENVATAIYKLLQQFPFSFISSFLTVLLVGSFFITSSDSGSLVVDALTSGGRHNSPVGQRIFWASMEGVVAIVLLIGGGLTALQTATIITGLPFAIILLVMCASFFMSLQSYYNNHLPNALHQNRSGNRE